MSIRYFLLIVVSCCVCSCGKYLPPLPPEDLAPTRANELSVRGTVEGVSFSWEAPSSDQRGEELKTIEGYYILRKTLVKESDLLDSDIEYEQVGVVNDEHLIERDKRREEARAQGKPTRRVKPDPALMTFQFVDSQVSAGSRYAYQIVPFNQGGVKGEAGNILVVTYRGESSEVQLVENSEAAQLLY